MKRPALLLTGLALVAALAAIAGQPPVPTVAPPAQQPTDISILISQEGSRRVALAVPPATTQASAIPGYVSAAFHDALS